MCDVCKDKFVTEYFLKPGCNVAILFGIGKE